MPYYSSGVYTEEEKTSRYNTFVQICFICTRCTQSLHKLYPNVEVRKTKCLKFQICQTLQIVEVGIFSFKISADKV